MSEETTRVILERFGAKKRTPAEWILAVSEAGRLMIHHLRIYLGYNEAIHKALKDVSGEYGGTPDSLRELEKKVYTINPDYVPFKKDLLLLREKIPFVLPNEKGTPPPEHLFPIPL